MIECVSVQRMLVPQANKGQKAFSVAVPMIWNNHPTVIRESVTSSTIHEGLVNFNGYVMLCYVMSYYQL